MLNYQSIHQKLEITVEHGGKTKKIRVTGLGKSSPTRPLGKKQTQID